MPTPAAALTTYDAMVAATTGATRMVSDFRQDLESISVNATKYQRVAGTAPRDYTVDSNTSYHVLKAEYAIHHHVPGADDQTYQNGPMLTAIDTFMDQNYWNVLGTSYQVRELSLTNTVRVGNVVSYTITVTVALKP